MLERIRKRRSVRTFRKTALNDMTMEGITEILKTHEAMKGPLGHQIRLHMLDIENPKQFGTYGIIKDPHKYIGGVCHHHDDAILDFGYLFESLILALTDLDIGTCWMAGTFKRSQFESIIQMDSMDLMPAVTPIGHFDKPRIFESLMRKAIKADNRQAFETLFFENSFDQPLAEDSNHPWYEALKSVQLAPSASNKQPWRILVDQEGAHFYLKEDEKYNKALGFPIQRLDMGIAMHHLEVLAPKDVQKIWYKSDTPPSSQFEYVLSFK